MDKILMPPPIEYCIQDIDGNEIMLSAKCLSRKMMKEIDAVAKRADDKDSKEGKDGLLHEQMAVFFGGVASDYDNIDLRVIKEVLEKISKEISGKSNPT